MTRLFSATGLSGLIALIFVAIALAASPGAIETAGNATPACSDSKNIAAVDPVVARGPHCTLSAHEHVHVGPQGVDSDETYASAIAKPTTFVIEGIHSWGAWPVWAYNGVRVGEVLSSSTGAGPGTAARSKGAAFYYRRKGAPAGVVVQPFPHGFAMVLHQGDVVNGNVVNIGNDPGSGTEAGGEIGFKCGPGSTPYTNNGLPPAVCSTNILVDNYVFPNCWNGVNAGEFVDEIAAGNMSYPVSGKCPAAFPIALPRLEQFRRSDVPLYQKGAATLDPTKFTLGGHPITDKGAAHADYAANWRDGTQATFLMNCINYVSPTSGTVVGRDCGTNSVGT